MACVSVNTQSSDRLVAKGFDQELIIFGIIRILHGLARMETTHKMQGFFNERVEVLGHVIKRGVTSPSNTNLSCSDQRSHFVTCVKRACDCIFISCGSNRCHKYHIGTRLHVDRLEPMFNLDKNNTEFRRSNIGGHSINHLF